MKKSVVLLTALSIMIFFSACSIQEEVPEPVNPDSVAVPVGPAHLVDMGDYYLVNNDDILLDKNDVNQQALIEAIKEANEAQETGVEATDRGVRELRISLWPKGIVKYNLSSDFSESQRQSILNAMFTIESICDVRFLAYPPGSYVYAISRSSDRNVCGLSTLGYTRNAYCELVCFDAGTILHEFLHGLGMTHEHQRSDRDGYITILWDNIIPQYKSAFDKCRLGSDSHLSGYDYDSIMHYGNYAFSKNGQKTIDSGTHVTGRRALSGGDMSSLIRLYGVPDIEVILTTYDESGNMDARLIDDLTSSSVLQICTAPSYRIGPPGSTNYVQFYMWQASDGMTIDDPYAYCTTARNFTSDGSITATYNLGGTPTPSTSIKPPPTVTPKPETYCLTTRLIDETGNYYDIIRCELDDPSVVTVCAPATVLVGSPYNKITLYFREWHMTGEAIIDNPYSNCAVITEIKSYVIMTAYYAAVTPTPSYSATPTDTPFPTPAKYTLTVRKMNTSGQFDETIYRDLTYDSTVNISAPSTLLIGNPNNPTLMNFRQWQLSGGAMIDNPGSCSTTVRHFTSNATVTTNYVPATVTIPPTATPTNSLAPTITQTPTPFPTPTHTQPPPVFYTMSVTYVSASGSSVTETYGNLTASSVINISAPPQVQVGPYQTIYFKRWYVSGTATIANVNSSSTTVTNFGSNVTVSASY
ncbi:MAG: hypothetical protein JW969_15885 [Spirochaetales bacterium]|nr:hypothetical protein [Spirochaetales bacterium]